MHCKLFADIIVLEGWKVKIHLTEVCINDFLLYSTGGYVTVVDVATGDFPVVQL